jgi:hypothetical protein
MSENKKDIKMKFVKIGILILVGLDIVFACSVPVYINNFSYYKKPLKDKIPFRIDGYYYQEKDHSQYQSTSIYFFYSDGFFIGGSHGVDNSTLLVMDANVDSSFNVWENKRETVQDRGAFIIDKDSVKIQLFNCVYNCYIFKKVGKIINDSTLLFIKTTNYRTQKTYDINETFHFRKLDWKPDSTYQIGFEKELKKHKYKF